MLRNQPPESADIAALKRRATVLRRHMLAMARGQGQAAARVRRRVRRTGQRAADGGRTSRIQVSHGVAGAHGTEGELVEQQAVLARSPGKGPRQCAVRNDPGVGTRTAAGAGQVRHAYPLPDVLARGTAGGHAGARRGRSTRARVVRRRPARRGIEASGHIETVVVAAHGAGQDTNVQGIAPRGRERDFIGRGARRRRIDGRVLRRGDVGDAAGIRRDGEAGTQGSALRLDDQRYLRERQAGDRHEQACEQERVRVPHLRLRQDCFRIGSSHPRI